MVVYFKRIIPVRVRKYLRSVVAVVVVVVVVVIVVVVVVSACCACALRLKRRLLVGVQCHRKQERTPCGFHFQKNAFTTEMDEPSNATADEARRGERPLFRLSLTLTL